MTRRVFLDHAATTPLSPKAKEACQRWLDAGNPSSLYAEGRAAKDAIDEAREIVSSRLEAAFAEVIFTSSGTESANLAILGAALAGRSGKRRRIVFSAAEHHCVLRTSAPLAALGYEVVLAPVDSAASISLVELEKLLQPRDVLLVAAMHSNNEFGTFNPMPQVGNLCKASGTLLFCDAVQTFGKLPISVSSLGADMVSLSAHKIYGPKGAAALYIRAGTLVQAIVTGGGQERELRAGTENVAAIVGLGAAASESHLNEDLLPAKTRLLEGLTGLGAALTVPADVPQLPSHIHVRFPGVPADTLLIALDRRGVSASSGAACSSGSIEPSHVMLAAGFDMLNAKEGLRFTLGRHTTLDDVKFALVQIDAAVDQATRGQI